MDDTGKELTYNPRYEELWAPKYGPDNPMVSDHHKAIKNTLSGYVEKACVNDFQFDNQRKTFFSYGYAIDPSSNVTGGDKIIGKAEEALDNKVATVFESKPLRPKDKRRRDRNDDPADVNGYLGPWAVYKDQILVAKPNEAEQAEIDELKKNKKKRVRRGEEKEEEESRSILHINDPVDYLGRSFLHIPQDLDKNLRSEESPGKCYIPKKCIHTYKGHAKGIQKMQLFPISGHLFLTCSMDSKVKVKINFILKLRPISHGNKLFNDFVKTSFSPKLTI